MTDEPRRGIGARERGRTSKLFSGNGTPNVDPEIKKPTQFGGSKGMSPQEASRRSHEVFRGIPAVPGTNIGLKRYNQSFAQKIREVTQDGWELVNAVYFVFRRAQELEDTALILESATWLADRGFGKPVQVTQLQDADGQPVAFTLWQPAADVEEALAAKRASEPDTEIIEAEQIQPAPELLPPPETLQDIAITDAGWERGIAKDWAKDTQARVTE